jgi:GNAT superfamily N-acetyltransferase
VDAPDAFLAKPPAMRGWSDDHWRRAFDAAVWVVAKDDKDQIIGLASSVRDGATPYIQAVWVRPGFRRHGVGRRLTEWLVEHERSQGCDEIRLWVIKGNDDARRVYEALGFKPTDHEQRIKRRLLEFRRKRYEAEFSLYPELSTASPEVGADVTPPTASEADLRRGHQAAIDPAARSADSFYSDAEPCIPQIQHVESVAMAPHV